MVDLCKVLLQEYPYLFFKTNQSRYTCICAGIKSTVCPKTSCWPKVFLICCTVPMAHRQFGPSYLIFFLVGVLKGCGNHVRLHETGGAKWYLSAIPILCKREGIHHHCWAWWGAWRHAVSDIYKHKIWVTYVSYTINSNIIYIYRAI